MKDLINILRRLLFQFKKKVTNIPYREIISKILKFVGGILHRALFNVLLPHRYREMSKQELFTIIFRSNTAAGKKFDIYLLILIFINMVVLLMESMEGIPRWAGIALRIAEWLFTIVFTFEYYLRIYCLDSSLKRKYLFSFYGIVDFLSIFPAYLSLLFPAAQTLSALRMMRLLRVFRIFRMDHFVEESRFLLESLKRSAVKVGIFMLFVFIASIILGATMYGIEGEQNSEISSIPKGIYWAVVTITTVGYGDMTPVTGLGRFVSMLVMLLGYAVIAVPTGIVAGETIEEHRKGKSKKGRKSNDEIAPHEHKATPDISMEEAEKEQQNDQDLL